MRSYRARGTSSEGRRKNFIFRAPCDDTARREAAARSARSNMTLKKLFHIEKPGVTNEVALA